MQELEKILYELEKRIFTAEVYNDDFDGTTITNLICLGDVRDILEKHMNEGWISVDQKPKKDYTAVFAVDKHDYYFVAVYDKEHGYRTNDVGADVDNIVSYCLFNQYRPERSNDEKE